MKYTGKREDIFGKGHGLTAREKALLMLINDNITAAWSGKTFRRTPNRLCDEFTFLTGFSGSVLHRIAKEVDENDGKLHDSTRPGPKKVKLGETRGFFSVV